MGRTEDLDRLANYRMRLREYSLVTRRVRPRQESKRRNVPAPIGAGTSLQLGAAAVYWPSKTKSTFVE